METQRTLTDSEKLAWLRLSRTENIGPLTFHHLLHRYKTAELALEALPDLARSGGRIKPLKIYPKNLAVKEMESLHAAGSQLIASWEPDYPPLLHEIHAPPPLLTMKGRLELASQSVFAVVGARNASMSGKKLAADLSQALGKNRWITASGLARGIDTTAHKASLETGTIAVVAGGIDQIYPTENESLFHEIAERGLVIAESPFGAKPQSSLFPRRNRIISGISRGTLVVEAALKSGSLITARYALEQGRDVFAVPGCPLDPRARGTNHLIREGAILTESFEDIDRELTIFPSQAYHPPDITEDISVTPLQNLDPVRKIILENLNYTPIRVDSLIQEYQISPADVWAILLEVEIAGRLHRQPGGYVSLKG